MTTPPDPDREMLRRAGDRLARPVAAAGVIVVVLVVVATLVLGWVFGTDDGSGGIPVSALLIAGTVGMILAGVLGFVIVRRMVAPLVGTLGRQRRFVVDAGHELRTPLTVVYNRAQLIARRMPPNDPALPAIRQLLDDSRALGEIVDDLLAGTQLIGDPGRAQSVDVRELLQEVAVSMTALTDQHDRTVVVTVPVDARVSGSRAALRRALTSLVDNVLVHNAGGGFIDLAATVTGDRVVLSVTDDGEGLSGPDQPQRNGPAAGGSRQVEDPEGRSVGIGLALVREVAVAHGGILRVGPGPSGGVRAEIVLPARS